MEQFKTNRGKPGILYEGFRFRKDRGSKTEPRRPIFLQRGSNTSSWPRKSCEYIGASETPKLSANAPLLCAQVYDRRKRNFCKMSANVIAPFFFMPSKATDNKINKLSLVMRKLDFCICENKDADQLRSSCAADQRLCFRYTDSTIPLLSKSEISSL